MQSLMERQAIPDPTPVRPSYDLPRMKVEEEMEKFIPIFETSLRMNHVPQELWKQKLLTHLPLDALVKIEEVLQEDGSTYEEAVGALRGTTALSFCSAAEDMCSGDRGRI